MLRDGIAYGVGLAAAAVLLGWWLGWGWAIPPAVLALFAAWFFRNPRRRPPRDESLLVSPADGKITAIESLPPESGYAHRISIFLSIFDVHVNRAPMAGRVTLARHQPGRFLNAMNPASARENEQNFVRLEGDRGAVAFIQIAGLIARRIVFWPRVGALVARGEVVGAIKFGSRVDLLLPPEAELLAHRGERVRGGASPLARLPLPAPAAALAAPAAAALAGPPALADDAAPRPSPA